MTRMIRMIKILFKIKTICDIKMIKVGTLVTRDKKTDMSERNDVDLPDKAKEEVEEDGEGEEDNEDGNAEGSWWSC